MNSEELGLIFEDDEEKTQKHTCTTKSNCLSSIHDGIATIVVGISAASHGYVLSYTSPALVDMDLLLILDNVNKKSLFSSLMPIGALFGSLVAGISVDQIGRKTTLLLSNIPLAVGWILLMLCRNLILLCTGRFILGVAVGVISAAAGLYIAEIANKSRRGLLCSGYLIFMYLGVILANALGLTLNWNLLAIPALVLIILSCLLVPLLPETPRWLINQGRLDSAKKALKWLNTSKSEEFVELELQEIADNIRNNTMTGFCLRDFQEPGVYKPLLIAFGLGFFQNFSGINAVLFYCAKIIQSIGFESNPVVLSILVVTLLLVFTIISCLLIDRVGRKPLLLISGFLMSLATFALGIFTLTLVIYGTSWLSLLSICAIVASFSIGWGPVPWLAKSELFPIRFRGVSGALTTTFGYLCMFIFTNEFLIITEVLTEYGTYFSFGCINLVGMIFVCCCLPETKGKSLEDIENMFVSSKT